jgi:tetratricopeptide (TPR) repeat protein
MVLIKKKKKKSAEEIEAEKQEKALSKAGIQDEFQAKGFELVEWVQYHQRSITMGLGVVALVLVVWGAYSYFGSGANMKASGEFEAALALYEKAQSAKDDKAKLQSDAAKAFEKIAKEKSGGVGRLSNLYVGHLGLEMSNAKMAIDAYGSFVKSASAKDPLRTIALLGLASAYEASSDPKKALESYEGILQSGVNVDEALVLWQASRLAKATGQDKKAKEFADKLAERYPSSPFVNQAHIPCDGCC